MITLSFFLGLAMLYAPYLWCSRRREDPQLYGLRWFVTREAWRDVVMMTVFTLIPLTPVALYWQPRRIPYSFDAVTVLEFLSAGTAAAFIEETFFRGFVQTMLTRRFSESTCSEAVGGVAAILITAAMFALTHLFIGPSWVRLATFFPGVIMGWLRWRHGSVMPSILYHMFGNVWSIWFFPR